MTIVSTHRIIGFDPLRPPRIETFPCIYLYFELDEAAPSGWCEELTRIAAKSTYPIEIDAGEGAIIETWVRKPDEIEGMLAKLKNWVAACNTAYDAKVNAPVIAATSDAPAAPVSPEQAYLNRVVAQLDFS